MNTKFCGICLSKPVKLYNIDEFYLRLYYEDIMSAEVIGFLPRYFCYICAAFLYKFHKFKDKCRIGQKLIQEVMQKGNGKITFHAISQVAKGEKKLVHSLDIITETERVKTFCIADDTLDMKIKIEPTDEIKNKIKDTGNDSDASTEFDNSYLNISNIIDEEKLNSDDEMIDKNDEKINFELEKIYIASQSVLNDHTYLGNDVPPPDLRRKIVKIPHVQVPHVQVPHVQVPHVQVPHVQEPHVQVPQVQVPHVQVPHIVKKSADTGNLRVLVVGEISNVNMDRRDKKIKSEKKTKKFVIRRHRLSKSIECNIEVNYKQLDLNPEHWETIRMNEAEAIAEYQSRANKPKYLKAQYKCDKCYTAFSTKTIMSKHMKLVHSEQRGPHECYFCHRRYRLSSLLQQHIGIHYTKYKCLRCGLEFHMAMSVQYHDELHSGLLRKCQHCDMEFRHKSTYYSHLRIYHRSEHVCNICGASFVSQKGLVQHNNLAHLATDNIVEEVNGENTYCKTCDITFVTLKGYMEHFKESVKHADPQTDANGDDKFNSKVPKTTGAPLKGGAYKSFDHFYTKKTTCLVCNEMFPSYTKYVVHHKKEHKGVPVANDMQLCEICGRSYKSSTMGFHLNTHTREKTYPCSTCGAQFYHVTSLTRHQMIHTGERPYQCPLCEKRFIQKVSMQIHHRKVHLKEPYAKRIRKRKLPGTV